jgi:hypothetical protein
VRWHWITDNMKNTWSHMRPTLSAALWFTVIIVIALAVVAYWVQYVKALHGQVTIESPLWIAGTIIAIGWFVTFGSIRFYPNTPSAQNQRKWIFIYLAATIICFAASFFLLQLVHSITTPTLGPAEWLIVIVTACFMVSAAFTFGAAIVSIIRFLMRI